MTYRIMQLHHGTVEFESTEKIGTTFRLIFPLLPSIAEPTPAIATEATKT